MNIAEVGQLEFGLCVRDDVQSFIKATKVV